MIHKHMKYISLVTLFILSSSCTVLHKICISLLKYLSVRYQKKKQQQLKCNCFLIYDALSCEIGVQSILGFYCLHCKGLLQIFWVKRRAVSTSLLACYWVVGQFSKSRLNVTLARQITKDPSSSLSCSIPSSCHTLPPSFIS